MIVTNRRVKKIICFVLIFAVSILFIPCTDNVWAESDAGKSAPDKTKYMLQKGSGDEEEASAEDSEGIGVHHQKATFQKNFDLTMEQKSATITDIENLVDETITDDMSDLEKYYTLAVAANKAVTYDWEFWSGAYNFDYYSHQWDSYGALNEGSVCAGIAIFYSQLCHAADLPCLFVISVFFEILKRIIRSRIFIAVIVVALYVVGTFFLGHQPTNDPSWFWNADSAFVYLLFY